MPVEKVLTPEVLAMIGKESAAEVGPDEVCPSEIRRFVQATMDENPLWYDEQYARGTKFGPGRAPATYPTRAVGFSKQPLGTPDTVRIKAADDDVRGELESETEVRVPWPKGMVSFHAGDEVEYFQLPKVGDIISRKSRVVDIVEKTGRSGLLGIVFVDHIYMNQKGEVLAINHHTSIARERPSSAAK